MKSYPVRDCVTWADKKSLGGVRLSPNQEIKAIATGEKRSPNKGEWYLSGSIVEAYKATNDLTTSFQIAKLCIVEKVTTQQIIKMAE